MIDPHPERDLRSALGRLGVLMREIAETAAPRARRICGHRDRDGSCTFSGACRTRAGHRCTWRMSDESMPRARS